MEAFATANQAADPDAVGLELPPRPAAAREAPDWTPLVVPALAPRAAESRHRVRLKLRSAFGQLAAALRGATHPGEPRPGHEDATTASWLTRALRAGGLLSADEAVTTLRVDHFPHRGLAGTMVRLHVTYADAGAAAAKGLPATFVMKLTKSDSRAARLAALSASQYREAAFYQRYRRDALPFLPRVFYARTSRLTGDGVVVLEDLQHHAIGVNLLTGNQVFGLPPLPANIPTDAEVLHGMFTSAAALHAKHWCDATLLQQRWLKGVDWYHGKGRAAWTAAMGAGLAAWNAVKAKAGAGGYAGVVWSPKLVAVIDASYARTSWEAFQTSLRDPAVPFTLTHGDFHAANAFWRPAAAALGAIGDRLSVAGTGSGTAAAGTGGADAAAAAAADADEEAVRSPGPVPPSELVLLDWSEVGVWEPTTDLGQAVISDVRRETWQAHGRGLVLAYWDALVARGVDPVAYPFSTCWDSFCIYPVQRWIWLFSLLATFPLPRPALQYFHDQLLGFITDHGDHPSYLLRPVVVVPRPAKAQAKGP